MLIPKRRAKRTATSFFYCIQVKSEEMSMQQNAKPAELHTVGRFIKQANDAVEIIKINDRAKYSLYLVMENIFEVK